MAMAKRGLVDRGEKPPRGVGSEPGDRQDWQRISGKMRRKSMPVLSVPGALVGGDEVTMAVFHELSRAEGPSQQGRKATAGSGSEPGDRQDWQRIFGKMRRKSMPVLSVPGALVGGDEVSMAVFHEVSRAERPSQQSRKTTAGSGLRTRGQTGLAANFRQNAPEIHASLVSPGGARGWR